MEVLGRCNGVNSKYDRNYLYYTRKIGKFHIDNAMFLSNNYSDDVWKNAIKTMKENLEVQEWKNC